MAAYHWKCSWGHVDPHGIAYYPRLVNAMHRAGEEYMDDLGVPYWETADRYGFDLPLVAMGMEFESPVEVGDVVTFSVDAELGTKSVRMEFTAFHEDGSVAFTGHEQHVCVMVDERKSAPLPDEFREILEQESE